MDTDAPTRTWCVPADTPEEAMQGLLGAPHPDDTTFVCDGIEVEGIMTDEEGVLWYVLLARYAPDDGPENQE